MIACLCGLALEWAWVRLRSGGPVPLGSRPRGRRTQSQRAPSRYHAEYLSERAVERGLEQEIVQDWGSAPVRPPSVEGWAVGEAAPVGGRQCVERAVQPVGRQEVSSAAAR